MPKNTFISFTTLLGHFAFEHLCLSTNIAIQLRRFTGQFDTVPTLCHLVSIKYDSLYQRIGRLLTDEMLSRL